MTPARLRVLLLGDSATPEMQPVADAVHALCAADDLQAIAEASALRQLSEVGPWPPDLIVAFLIWPGEFTAADVRELVTHAPLSRLVCVCGAWCDSEGRTHAHWPLAVRVTADCAPDRVARELSWLRGAPGAARPSGLPAAPLPLTASRTEIFEGDFGGLWPVPRRARVAVESPDRAFQQALCATLAAAGFDVETERSSGGAEALLWDADPWDAVRRAELAACRTAHPAARLVAAAGFLRSDLVAELRSAGANAVWSKLAPISRLCEALDAEEAALPRAGCGN